jgi:hypothetical protein
MSSFSDRPPPPEPEGDDESTRRPARRRRREREDDEDEPRARRREYEDDEDEPRLGKLAQQARSKELKQARGILIVVGVLTVLFNAIDFAMVRSAFQDAVQKEINKRGGPGMVVIDRAQLQREEDRVVLLGRAIDGGFIALGVVFIVLGVVVYRFPVPATVAGLVLYLAGTLITVALLLALNPGALAAMSIGFLIRIVFIVAFIKAVQAAIAYEKAQRREAAFD